MSTKQKRKYGAVRKGVETTAGTNESVFDKFLPPAPPEAKPTPVTPVTVVTPVTRVTGDAAPKRDFTRVANSVVRDAIPAGVFSGKGKQLYDFLYTRTRGAIVPTHSARIPTEHVMKGAGMTRHTYRAHLQRLVSSGLIRIEEKPGEHGGNIFTVYLPEEIGINRGDRGDRGDTSVTVQDRHLVQGSQVDRGDRGLSVSPQKTSEDTKTLIKTNTYDDEEKQTFSDFVEVFCEANRKLTGRAPKVADREQWGELAKLIVAELNEAAARAGAVSSVPAFLAAHLKRKFSKPSSQKREGKSPAAPVDVSAPATIPDPDRRLTPAEIAEQSRIIAELLESGYTLEQAEEQFAGSYHPDDWVAIRAATLAPRQEGK